MPDRPSLQTWWLIASGVMLQGCVTGLQNQAGAPLFSVDSPSATCRYSLSGCIALYGKEAASVSAVLKVALEETEKQAIERALSECADMARSTVLLRHAGEFPQLTPTAEDCNRLVANAKRKGTTWAMQLGIEMHEEALACAEVQLGKSRPGGFSREQRYRYDSRTERWKTVSRQEERALEESGNRGELRGTLVPDIVIHTGDPLRALGVYDFKFPCVNTSKPPEWDDYPSGHPYDGVSQGRMYQVLFDIEPLKVVPRLGIVP